MSNNPKPNWRKRSMDLNEWAGKEIFKISSKLIEVNNHDLMEKQIEGVGTKDKVYQLLDVLKESLFPMIYLQEEINDTSFEIKVSRKLLGSIDILNGLLISIFCKSNDEEIAQCLASDITAAFISQLPEIREMLSKDIISAVNGDPAAVSHENVMLSYPCFEAITIYRLAHALWTLRVPLIPRIMTEFAHAHTGIDIHPGAKIGEHFFIAHGTGVVIGETCVIGKNVKLYQGVTLGAKSFETDERGTLLSTKRHPDIEDNVIIYSGATILGGNTRVGHDSVIGGNVWLVESVPPYSKVYNSAPSPSIK